MFNNIKSFTLVETITVIVVIGILMMGTTIYFGGYDEKRKIIEAQGCTTTIGGHINNYIFYSLTSKNLTKNFSPDVYNISLNGGDSDEGDCTKDSEKLCDTIVFWYPTSDNPKTIYKTYSVHDTCHMNHLRFFRNSKGTSSPVIHINKGFTPTNINDPYVFYIENYKDDEEGSKKVKGDIITVLCLDNDCESKKEISKRFIDGRTQTISLKNCAFYNEDDTCKTREGCRVYDDDDITECLEY